MYIYVFLQNHWDYVYRIGLNTLQMNPRFLFFCFLKMSIFLEFMDRPMRRVDYRFNDVKNLMQRQNIIFIIHFR